MGRCPVDIPIASFMQFYNSKLLQEKTEDEMSKALAFEQKWGILVDRQANASDCVKCGRCEMACTQHLDIVCRLEKAAEWEKTANSLGND